MRGAAIKKGGYEAGELPGIQPGTIGILTRAEQGIPLITAMTPLRSVTSRSGDGG